MKLPKIEINEHEKLWLETLYHKIINNESIEYRIVRVELFDKLPIKFDPNEIDENLVNGDGERITLLGIHYINSKIDILSKTNKVISCIRLIIGQKTDSDEILTSTISKKIKLPENEVGLILKLINQYDSFYDGCTTSNEFYGYSKIKIYSTKKDVFDKYIFFENIETKINEHYEKLISSTKKYKLSNVRTNRNNLSLTENSSMFVDHERIEQLKKMNNEKFDLSKLIRKCEELNIAYSSESYFSVSMLIRAITDHIPPIFNKNSFSEVAGGYGTKSFKDSMIHLDKSSRKIADSFLHTHIRRKESLPTKTQVNFSNDLDVLLGEIVRILQ